MIERGFSKSLSDWIGSNLKKSGEHETWSFNLEGAIQMFNSFRYLLKPIPSHFFKKIAIKR